MKKYSLMTIFLLGFMALTAGVILKFTGSPPPAEAAPTVLTGSLQAGCYLITPTVCKLSVEPFSISIAPGEQLISFNLTANDNLLYDFGASTAAHVTGNYTPSTVALDFAAECSETYTLKLQALDTGDLDFVTIGQTQPIKCPSATFKYYLPFLEQ